MSLRFFAKTTFVCNMFFLVAFCMRYRQFITQQDIDSHIILLGWLLAPLANIVFTIWWAIGKKWKKEGFPVGIGIANTVFLLIQIYLFFILR